MEVHYTGSVSTTASTAAVAAADTSVGLASIKTQHRTISRAQRINEVKSKSVATNLYWYIGADFLSQWIRSGCFWLRFENGRLSFPCGTALICHVTSGAGEYCRSCSLLTTVEPSLVSCRMELATDVFFQRYST